MINNNIKDFKPNILICSCEHTSDIAIHMATSLLKYTSIENYNVYIGSKLTNKFKHFNYIDTPQNNWRSETLFQLREIKKIHPENPYILLLLDDFVFNKHFSIQIIKKLHQIILENNIKYLVLKPTFENFFYKTIDFIKSIKVESSIRFYPIRKNHPYYFSLQTAIWDIDYLIHSIEKSKHIWDFETLKNHDTQHFSVLAPILSYRHIVEKGEWDYNVEKYCIDNIGFFDPGNRNFRKRQISSIVKYYLSKYFIFPVFGYLFLRIRKNLNL